MNYTDKQNPRNIADGIVHRKDGIENLDLNLIYYDAFSPTSQVQFENEFEKINGSKVNNWNG